MCRNKKKKDDFTHVYISTTLGNSDVGISKYAPNGSVSSFCPSETLESRAESLIWMKYSIRVYMTIFIKFDQLYGDFSPLCHIIWYQTV